LGAVVKCGTLCLLELRAPKVERLELDACCWAAKSECDERDGLEALAESVLKRVVVREGLAPLIGALLWGEMEVARGESAWNEGVEFIDIEMFRECLRVLFLLVCDCDCGEDVCDCPAAASTAVFPETESDLRWACCLAAARTGDAGGPVMLALLLCDIDEACEYLLLPLLLDPAPSFGEIGPFKLALDCRARYDLSCAIPSAMYTTRISICSTFFFALWSLSSRSFSLRMASMLDLAGTKREKGVWWKRDRRRRRAARYLR